MKIQKTSRGLVLALIAGLVALAPVAAFAQDDTQASAEARKARILANLKVKFPMLETAQVQIGDIVATEFAGLERGSFVIAGRGQQQFLVSTDDTKFYLISGEPIDVSLSEEEIQKLVAEREATKQREADGRNLQIADAIAGLPMRGNPDAPVTIVEFSEFQCPYCARGAETISQLLAKYPDDVKVVYLHFPLDFHDWAKPAAIAAHCVGQQDAEAFWKLHDQYFANQRALKAGNLAAKTREFLEGTGIDLDVWSSCAEDTESEAYQAAAARVDADTALGKRLGVSGTPGFFVNGHFLKGAQPIASFEPLIEQIKSRPAADPVP